MDNIILSPIQRNELVSEIAHEVISGIKELLGDPQKPVQEDRYITRKETAELLKVSLVTLSHWTKRSILKSYKIGSRVLYKRSEVIDALREIEQFKGN